MPRALVADRAKMFVDAKHDQDEFRRDPREDDADNDAGDRGQQLNESPERADRHRSQTGKNAGNTEQTDQCNDEPVKCLDDGGCDEAVLPVPLRGSPSAATISSFERGLEKGQSLP